ncbi:MAG: YbhB/YbcL family Raf kinase inhibitor-like protein [Acidimicrobiia bacterium]
MELTSPDLIDGAPIPGVFAFAVPDPTTRVTFAANRNPALHWAGVPEGTHSFALLVIDRDAPSVRDDANKEDREVPSDLPRVDFTHWTLIDLPPETRSITEAAFCEGVTPRGKPGLSGGPREGVNDYTGWFAGDPDMEGTYKGYDGPCPPWNDSIPHRYDFTVYALDVDRLDVEGDFTGADVLAAMEGHILDSASLQVTYALNPRLA